jgi:hypothetical protein
LSKKATPLGYIKATDPQTTREAFSDWRVADRALSISKSAIQNYLWSFLSPDGPYRKFITSSMSPVGIQFVTDLSYDEEMQANPNQRKVYLARFFAENTGRLPSILIIDTGVEYQDMGVADLVGSSVRDGRWEGELLFFLKINLSIMVATTSEEDTGILSSLVLAILGPMSNALNNYIIREPGSKWEIRLPLAALHIGQASNIPLEGDNKTTIWTRSLDFTIDFESFVTLVQDMPTVNVDANLDLELIQKPFFMNFAENQNIPLGTPYQILVHNMRKDYYLAVSNPDIALVTMDPPYILQPRRQGTALLLVMDRRGPKGRGTDLEPVNESLVMDIPFRVTI